MNWNKFKHWLIKKLGGIPKCEFEALEREFETYKTEKANELHEKEKEISRLKRNDTNSPISRRRIIDFATYFVEPISLQTVYNVPYSLRNHSDEVIEEKIINDCVMELCKTIVTDKLYNLRWSEYDAISLTRQCLIELKIYPPERRTDNEQRETD